MRSTLYISIISLFVCSSAFAFETWKIPQFNTASQAIAKFDVPQDLQIDHPLIQVKVLRGWSVGHEIDVSDTRLEILSISPNKDLANSKTFILINRDLNKSDKTVQMIFDSKKKKPDSKVEKRVIHGTEWVYSSKINPSEKNKEIAMITVKAGTRWVVIAAWPTSEDSIQGSKIEGILNSITLK